MSLPLPSPPLPPLPLSTSSLPLSSLPRLLLIFLFSSGRDEESNQESDEESEEESDEEAAKADEDRKARETRNVNPNRPVARSDDTRFGAASYKGLLVCNEVSDVRRARLRRVLEGFLPDLVIYRKIQITAQVCPSHSLLLRSTLSFSSSSSLLLPCPLLH